VFEFCIILMVMRMTFEFKNNIVRAEGRKESLYLQDAFVNLKGVGVVGEISFTDNSSWMRSRRFSELWIKLMELA
jgi:hypothetical protein